MLNRLRNPDLRPILAALYAVAMLWLGFAHHMGQPGSAAAAGLERIVLPDGSVAEFCLPGADHKPGGTTGKSALPCDACLLTAMGGVVGEAPGLPRPAEIGASLTFVLEPAIVAQQRAERARSRGPPSLV
ncbi:hypothetical protein E8L99_20960 [Phreatobacter aquaticus]|uniref:DUF2946 domain-containing protein n=1 Tax=Phreatobacter aquaticus TaxID=2570229 RepID=A0A4D7QRD2_9HYPH|nr:hypothetical protein [Phreatobacter aquaticus]QCK88049.1 hypothetical protein E8L99_20960 [Phreatobacter aquaticus]